MTNKEVGLTINNLKNKHSVGINEVLFSLNYRKEELYVLGERKET